MRIGRHLRAVSLIAAAIGWLCAPAVAQDAPDGPPADPPDAPPAAPAETPPAAPAETPPAEGAPTEPPPPVVPATPVAPPEAPPTDSPAEPSTPALELDAGVLYLAVSARVRTGEVDASDVRSIYLGRRKSWPDGTEVKPLLRRAGTKADARLQSKVLDMTHSAYKRYWQKRQLSGRGVMPKAAPSADVLLRLVATRPGAVGYVLGEEIEAPPPGVELIRVK